VLFTEFLGQRSAHDLLTEMRRGREVSLSALSTGRANVYQKNGELVHGSRGVQHRQEKQMNEGLTES
jgi:hypothetical protein